MSGATWAGQPRGLATLFFTEMWERFSYYGMRAILVLAMVAAVEGSNAGLGLSREMASAIYGIYTSAVYLASLPGGWIADRLIGQQRAVLYGGIIIAAGHFTMAFPGMPTFFIGMILIALGTGLLKPNVSALVGEMYPEGGARRDAGFSVFYMGINTGAFIGQIICGYLGEQVGWHYGFGAAGVFMLIGVTQYVWTKHHLHGAGDKPASSGDPVRDERTRKIGWFVVGLFVTVLAAVTLAALSGALVINPVVFSQGAGVFIVSLALAYFSYVILFGGLSALEKKQVGVIVVLFVAAATFWSGFEQAGSSFNLFAQDYTDRIVFGWEIPASWLQSVNPMFIILLAPFFAALWIKLGARNIYPSVPFKFAIGLLQMGVGFLVLYFAARYVVAGEKVSPAWLILTYLFHTTGELCLSPVGLSAVTKLAPKRYVGQMMGTWFMAAALGHLIAGLLGGSLASEDDFQAMPDRFLFVFMTTTAAGVLMLGAAMGVRKFIGEVK